MSQTNPPCPNCGHKLKTILYGLISSDIDKDNYVLGGCACFGDDRDAAYYCPNCRSSLGKNMQEIKLIQCPAISSGSIFPEECKNYNFMKSKKRYVLLNNPEKICKLICPNIGRKVVVTLFSGEKYIGICKRTVKQTFNFSYNTLWLKSDDENKTEDIVLAIKDIETIELVHSESSSML